jgi:hypothetical protein
VHIHPSYYYIIEIILFYSKKTKNLTKLHKCKKMMKTLLYDYYNGYHTVYDEYTIDTFGIVRDMSGFVKPPYADNEGYQRVYIRKNGKTYSLYVHRAVASSFIGKPPTRKHTADHYNGIRNDNCIDNIRWATPKEQAQNRTMPCTNKSAIIVVKDGIEKTVKEWVKHLEHEKTPYGNMYTNGVIAAYAKRKQHGFSYKVFDDLPGEIWKVVPGSTMEISNKLRVKRVTKYTTNVIDVTQLHTSNGYPMVYVNGKQQSLHTICFQSFFPDEYKSMSSREIIRHKYDDKLDFRPENLLIGTKSQNMSDAHDNGKFNDTKIMRKKCVSYIDGVEEKEHNSLHDATHYLREHGYNKAAPSNINTANGTNKIRYGRTWKLVYP